MFKKLLALSALVLSLTAHSSAVEDTVWEIEQGNDVECHLVDSSWNVGLNGVVSWKWLTYECDPTLAGAPALDVVLRVKTSYDSESDSMVQEVTKVEIEEI